MPAGRKNEVRRILIKADTTGDRNLRKMSRQLGKMNKNVKSTANSLGFMKRALIGITAGLGIREVARMSDGMELLNSRIKVLTTDGADSVEILGMLKDAANETKAPVDALGEIYARLAAATKETGISSSLLIDLTKTLQNTFRLSGSTIMETTSAAIQLSQGLASGELRGQELRSVLEANVVIGDLLSKSFGVTRGELYKLAEAGDLTANKVMVALFTNMDEVNEKASRLGQTTEQTVTVAINDLKLAIFDLNREFNVSGGFAASIEFVKDNLKNFGFVIAILAATQIPALITAIKGLGTALFALNLNPIVTAFSVSAIAIGLMIMNTNSFVSVIFDLEIAFTKLLRKLAEYDLALNQLTNKLPGIDNTKLINANAKNINAYSREIAHLTSLQIKLKEESDKANNSDDLKKRIAEREAFIKKLLAAGAKGVQKLKAILAAINKEYLRTGDVEKYYDALRGFNFEKLKREFKEGKIDLDKYNKGLREIQLQDLNKQLSKGTITFQKFNESADHLKLESLNEQLRAGKINLIEYNSEFNKLQTQFSQDSAISQGMQDYIASIGTLSESVADAITSTFSNLEDSFVDFVKTGKLEFSSLANAILEDLTRVILRAAIIRPLMQGLTSAFSPGAPNITTTSGGSTSLIAAKGASFNNGVREFASGGVVSKPTLFGYGGGSTGLMGEAGSEAILPLSRGKGGDLGVQATVTPVNITIINNSGSEVETRESSGPNGERQLDMIIHGKVKEGIGSGAYDRLFKSSYGLTRKGS